MAKRKQLLVLRHAKSSWDDPRLEDHERPLAPRGRRAVKLLAEHLRANDIHPVQVLCSTSQRTLETLEGIDPNGERLIEPELYGASPEELLKRLQRVPAEIDSVMLIGHNPAVQMLVLRLAGTGSTDDSIISEVRSKFPTAGLAMLSFEGTWDKLAPGRAQLVGFLRPKELAGGGKKRRSPPPNG